MIFWERDQDRVSSQTRDPGTRAPTDSLAATRRGCPNLLGLPHLTNYPPIEGTNLRASLALMALNFANIDAGRLIKTVQSTAATGILHPRHGITFRPAPADALSRR